MPEISRDLDDVSDELVALHQEVCAGQAIPRSRDLMFRLWALQERIELLEHVAATVGRTWDEPLESFVRRVGVDVGSPR